MRNILFLFLLLSQLTLWAQPKQNSPYSRYGIGDLLPQTYANQAGWGRQSAAFHDPFHLNFANPASLAHLRSTVLETGIYAKSSDYLQTSDNTKLNNWSGNLAYLSIGFTLKSPINEALDKIKSPWSYGMGFSLTPNSLVGYNIQTTEELPNLGKVVNAFEGNGGTYRLGWSTAAKYKHTAFGVTLGSVFGKSIYENTTFFSDSLPTFQYNSRDDININGFVWNVGVQHDFVFKHFDNDKAIPKKWITLGLTAESSHKMKVTATQIRLRSRGILSNGEYSEADTLLFKPESKESLSMPATLSFGIQYVNANKLKLGLQVGYEGWESYKNTARPDVFRNVILLSGGVEYTPNFSSYNKFLKRVRYRAGAYYNQDPRTVNGKNFNDVGVSFGFGLPLVLPRQQTSFINTSFEFGKIGAGTAIEEKYARITLGFTLNDNTWFYKRRFE